MTLQVAYPTISINNAAGQLKFTSNDKLLYKRYYQEGSVSFDGTDLYVPFESVNSKNDMLVGYMRIDSCTGAPEATSALIGTFMPIGSVLIDFTAWRGANSIPRATSEIIAVSVVKSSLVFRGTRLAASEVTDEYGKISTGIRTTNITYKVSIWSYL